MRHLTTVVFALLAASCLAGSAYAGNDRLPELRIGLSTILRDIVIPSEWSGIWDFDDLNYDCETNQLIDSEAYLDTLCSGSSIEFDEPGFPITCTGSADATTVSYTCTGSIEVDEDCVMEFSNVTNATRNGDTLDAVQTVSITLVGTGCIIPMDECTRTVSTATRIGPQPNPCEQTPVERVDWGTVKSLYR